MQKVLQHPFFSSVEALSKRIAPPLGQDFKHHCFLSHFQGNAGPRAMTIKYAVEHAVPMARVWLDQVRRSLHQDKRIAAVVALPPQMLSVHATRGRTRRHRRNRVQLTQLFLLSYASCC